MAVTTVAAVVAFLGASCAERVPREPTPFVDPFRGAVPEIDSAAISVLRFREGLVAAFDGSPPSDGLDELELALWASGHVVWRDPDDATARHRAARVAPETVRELARAVARVIDARREHPGLAVDVGYEQVCVRLDGLTAVERVQGVFARRAPWNGRLPVAYADDPPHEDARRRDRERYPEWVEFLSAWHAVKEELHGALPTTGELVDRAKLATLGVR